MAGKAIIWLAWQEQLYSFIHFGKIMPHYERKGFKTAVNLAESKEKVNQLFDTLFYTKCFCAIKNEDSTLKYYTQLY